MSNRKERRRAQAIAIKIPNISGTDEACRNCRFGAQIDKLDEINDKLRSEQYDAPDAVVCCRFPNPVSKKAWGWCGEWQKQVRKKGELGPLVDEALVEVQNVL